MSTLKRLRVHMQVAEAYASLSHAKRLKVGAVLIRDDRPIAVGYNGMPSGMDNNCETNPVKRVDGIEMIDDLVTRPEVVHAEANVISFAARNGVRVEGCTLVTTDTPCYDCAKLIIQSGIEEVVFGREYRDLLPIKFLKQANIRVRGMKE